MVWRLSERRRKVANRIARCWKSLTRHFKRSKGAMGGKVHLNRELGRLGPVCILEIRKQCFKRIWWKTHGQGWLKKQYVQETKDWELALDAKLRGHDSGINQPHD